MPKICKFLEIDKLTKTDESMKSYLFVNNFGSNYQTVTYSRPHLKGFDMRNLQNNIRICQNPKIKSQCPCQHSNLFYDSDFTYYIFISS